MSASRELPPLPEPSSHMFPSDLEKFKSSETTATAFSVAVGCPGERSVPLYTLSDLIAYAEQREAATARKCVEVCEGFDTDACDPGYIADAIRGTYPSAFEKVE
jgi:hypothetical protein